MFRDLRSYELVRDPQSKSAVAPLHERSWRPGTIVDDRKVLVGHKGTHIPESANLHLRDKRDLDRIPAHPRVHSIHAFVFSLFNGLGSGNRARLGKAVAVAFLSDPVGAVGAAAWAASSASIRASILLSSLLSCSNSVWLLVGGWPTAGIAVHSAACINNHNAKTRIL